MSTDTTVSPLRQRMIEDMAARKLGPHSHRSHIDSCRRFATFLGGVYLRVTPQTRPDAAICELARSVERTDPLERLHALAGAVRARVDYVPGSTNAHTEAAEALADGKGVCQDHAHIFIAAARSLGVPARYVTGYLVVDTDNASEAHHAWAEAWVEGLGWVGFDVANRICPTERYVRLAVGLDARYAAPVIGSRSGGAAEALEVCVEVQRQSSQQ